jgi:PIN domain nuclease of toxin-antitoxin system
VILLDTHTLVWLVAEPKRLSAPARRAIAGSRDGLAIADITLWELAVLFQRGRLRAFGTVDASVRLVAESAGASVKPITPEIAALAAQFPDDYPRDPADRLIGATARAEGLALVTRDEGIRASKLVKTIW